MCSICTESDCVDDGAAPFRRSFVVRVAWSADSRVPDDEAEASGASGLAGCVDGNGGRGVVAHPAITATTPEKTKILEMNMAVFQDAERDDH
jgi:hypothetical protein